MPYADPAATLDYAVDWTAWLQTGETITTATWTIPAGITQPAGKPPTVTGGKATVWLTGGTPGTRYPITCHITTSAGRQDERTMTIDVRER